MMSEGADMEQELDHLEIEHKFLLDDGFDDVKWMEACRALSPLNEKQLRVQDTYYLPGKNKAWIYRHRYDEEIQQLTVKSRGGDTEVRTEINLDLSGENQDAKIAAFLKTLNIEEKYEIVKQIHVFDFPDCEVVQYHARCGSRSVSCLEFEAIGAGSVSDALATLERYETAMGYDASRRTKINLFDLLVSEGNEGGKP
jgi:hypothetical protein